MTDICTIENINNLKKIIEPIGWVTFFSLTIYILLQMKKVRKIEKKIDSKQEEIDNLPKKMLQKVRNSLVNQSQLDRMIAKEQKPLDIELRDLKRQRQFVLDKLPFFGMLKK